MGAAAPAPALQWHQARGKFAQVNGDTVRRTSSFYHCTAFTAAPINPGSGFAVEISEYGNSYSGSLKIGLTWTDPASLSIDLPANMSEIENTINWSGRDVSNYCIFSHLFRHRVKLCVMLKSIVFTLGPCFSSKPLAKFNSGLFVWIQAGKWEQPRRRAPGVRNLG